MYTLLIGIMSIILVIGYILVSKPSKAGPKKPMTDLQRDVVSKLRQSDEEDFRDKLWDNVCPLCGENLELFTYGLYEQFSDHWCVNCGFSTEMEVL